MLWKVKSYSVLRLAQLNLLKSPMEIKLNVFVMPDSSNAQPIMDLQLSIWNVNVTKRLYLLNKLLQIILICVVLLTLLLKTTPALAVQKLQMLLKELMHCKMHLLDLYSVHWLVLQTQESVLVVFAHVWQDMFHNMEQWVQLWHQLTLLCNVIVMLTMDIFL